MTVALTVTLVINLLTTGKPHAIGWNYPRLTRLGLIAWKLWRVRRDVSSVMTVTARRPSILSKLLRIIVESQLLYTLFVALSLAMQCEGERVQSYADNLVRTHFRALCALPAILHLACLTDEHSYWNYLRPHHHSH